jgi:cell division protein FtsB
MAQAASAKLRARSGIRWDRIGRYALLATLFVILLLYISPAKRWIQQSHAAGEQTRQLEQLKTDHARLERRLGQLRDPRALEREARKLGMVRHGERAFVIENLRH